MAGEEPVHAAGREEISSQERIRVEVIAQEPGPVESGDDPAGGMISAGCSNPEIVSIPISLPIRKNGPDPARRAAFCTLTVGFVN